MLTQSGMLTYSDAEAIASEPAADLDNVRVQVRNAQAMNRRGELACAGAWIRDAIRGRFPLRPELAEADRKADERQLRDQQQRELRDRERSEMAKTTARRTRLREWLETVEQSHPRDLAAAFQAAIDRPEAKAIRGMIQRQGWRAFTIQDAIIAELATKGLTPPEVGDVDGQAGPVLQETAA